MSNEAENCFIGIILDNSKLLDDYDLIANDFMGLDNRQIFQAILSITCSSCFCLLPELTCSI